MQFKGYGMKVDNNGIFYYDETSRGNEVIFNSVPKRKEGLEPSKFYELIDNPNLLIKYAVTHFDDEKIRYMLKRFILLQSKINKTDLPTSYYMENGMMQGTVVPYYKDCKSLYTISETNSLEELMKYYKHDDDYIHNLFILLSDILDITEELADNGIYYYDNHPGNFVFKDNEVQLIDFDPAHIKYEVDKKGYRKMLENYDQLVFLLNKRFELADLCVYYPKNIKGMRKHLIKIENKIRR